MIKKLIVYLVLTIFGMFVFNGCETYYFRSNYKDVNALMHDSKHLQVKPFLKAHLKNGDVLIFKDTWVVDTTLDNVKGNVIRYDFNRKQTYAGNIILPIDSVAIFETNKKLLNTETGRVSALSILSGVDVAVGLMCLSNPKACFGSCPTFYLNENENFHHADAEGFSNAISPSMEYFDIDALNNKSLLSKSFSITMKNEALETHCVNDVKLLAYPRKKGERIFQTSTNEFYLCENTYTITEAHDSEKDVSALLKYDDGQERFSLADEKNLSSREEIFIDFKNIKDCKNVGLIMHFRQTMMSTYIFYSAMGFMGDNVGDIFSIIETNDKISKKFDATIKELGDIDVYVWNTEKKLWENQSGLNETGPIAINKQIIPFHINSDNSNIKLKIVLNKGLWRIDYLALTNIKEKVTPVDVFPTNILNKGVNDVNALSLINNPNKYLISMPGSEYKFNFTLPEKDTDYELFLYSKGYYLEWMRQHWLKDKDLFKLREMVYKPKKFLKQEAKNYKQYEVTMEQEFWNSKIDTKKYSYYEH